jgi:putative nucleotidyltransferase with HDIG domain
MRIFARKNIRRQEIARTRAERSATLWQRLQLQVPWPRVALAVGAALATAIAVNIGGSALTLRIGQNLERALTSRVDFRKHDRERTASERLRARSASESHYTLDTLLLEDLRGRFLSGLTLAKMQSDDPDRVRSEARKQNVILDDTGLEELMRIAAEEDTSTYTRQIDSVIERLRSQPLVESSELASARTASYASLRDPNRDSRRLAVGKLLIVDDGSIAKVAETASSGVSRNLRDSIQASLIAMLTTGDSPRALYRFDSARTTEAAAQAEAAVENQYTQINRGAVFVDAGPISSESFELIRAEHQAYADSSTGDWFSLRGRESLGRASLAALAVLVVLLHLLIFPRAATDNIALMQHITYGGVSIVLVLLTRLVFASSTTLPPQIALIPQVLSVALAMLIYNRQSVVFPLTLSLAIVLTLAIQQNVAFFFLLFATSALVSLGLRDVRQRGQIVVYGLVASLVAAVLTGISGLLEGQTLAFLLRQVWWAVGTTMAAMFLIEGMLPLIERIFHLATSLRLLEWCDANKPLLRMMAAEAPGTYNHSLLVGTLAASAADSIGANGLLCRAGAYYHDIGKINKPEYFVENQAMRPNRHDRLSPAMSLLIIVGHVKDGVEMAKEYRLPSVLRPFIAEHHGTTLVEYFYHAASKSRKPDDPELSDTEFRYPGPKPRSRESGIIMLCDGIEGAVRAMTEPTPARIEDTVDAIARKRLLDGQLDDCQLTFRDIATIKRSLVKSLCAIYHSRISYPKSEEEPTRERQPNIA